LGRTKEAITGCSKKSHVAHASRIQELVPRNGDSPITAWKDRLSELKVYRKSTALQCSGEIQRKHHWVVIVMQRSNYRLQQEMTRDASRIQPA
jgi:hypothetical protein